MITCNFCGISFSSVEDFEKHMNTICSEKNIPTTYMGTQIIHSDGKIEFRQLNSKFQPSDDFSHEPPFPTKTTQNRKTDQRAKVKLQVTIFHMNPKKVEVTKTSQNRLKQRTRF
jgi:hypothetical protein